MAKLNRNLTCYTYKVVQQEHLCWGDWTGMANTSSARCKGNFNTAWVILTASICWHQIIPQFPRLPLSIRVFIWCIWWCNGQVRSSNASITRGKCLCLLFNTKANGNFFQAQGQPANSARLISRQHSRKMAALSFQIVGYIAMSIIGRLLTLQLKILS